MQPGSLWLWDDNNLHKHQNLLDGSLIFYAVTCANSPVTDSILTPQSPAPPDYYQNIFCSVFEFVLTRFAGIAADSLISDLQSYLDASSDAQRLFARLLTRKGPTFLTASLKYAEITQLEQAISELGDLKLLQLSGSVPADQLLTLLTKAQIVDYFSVPKIQAKTSKGHILDALLSSQSDLQICQRCQKQTAWITITAPQQWRLISTLYFGNAGQDWSTFVRRDLGLLAYESVALHAQQFATRNAMEEHLEERVYSSLVYRLDELPHLANALLDKLTQTATVALGLPSRQRLRQRSLLRLGKWAEKEKLLGIALSAYEHTNIPPARERQVRILSKEKRLEEANSLIAAIKKSPISATERLFTERFGKRGGGYQPPTTVIEIQETPESVEDFVLQQLLKTLTGLIYWPICFAPLPGAFTNLFQAGPHDLFETDFFLQRQLAIENLEASLALEADFIAHITEIARKKQGIANRLVSWGLLESVTIDEWLTAIPFKQLQQLSQFLIRNLSEYRRGFPDLFICYESGHVEYVEVKGPSDQLQPQQRAWFEEFKRMNVPARVVKLLVRK
jgi:hypothetical protein